MVIESIRGRFGKINSAGEYKVKVEGSPISDLYHSVCKPGPGP